MKKLKTILLLVFTTFTIFGQIPEKPNPHRFVNDYINLLSPTTRQALEQKIADYDQQTQIQIAVVILKDLGGDDANHFATQLGEQWGVGHSGANTGIVVLVGLDSRDFYIATGRGMEEYLPDIVCTRIFNDIAKPALRNGDYDGAVSQSVQAIMNHFGSKTLDQHKQERAAYLEIQAKELAARKERQAKEHAEMMALLGNVLLFLFILGSLVAIVWFIVRSIREWLRKRALRKANKVRYSELFAHQHATEATVDEAKLPSWAKKNLEQYSLDWSATSKTIDGLVASFNPTNQKDPDAAKGILDEMEQKYKTRIAINEKRESIHTVVADNRNTAQGIVDNVLAIVGGGLTLYNQHTLKGVRIPETYGTTLQHLKTWNKNLLPIDDEQTPDIIKKATEYEASAKGAVAKVENYIKAKSTALQYKKEVLDGIAAVTPLLTNNKDLAYLQANTHGGFTKNFEQKLAAIPGVHTQLSKQIAMVDEYLGDNDKQNYEKALEIASGVSEIFISQAKNVVNDIASTAQQVKTAIASYPAAKSNAESAISKAASKCSDSDVESTAKSYLREAKTALEIAEKYATGKQWLDAIQSINKAKNDADKAYRRAQSDIDEAERERERARERERERQRQIALEASRRSSSGSFGGGGGRSGGGSFGGGSFGGGGGGGKW